MSLTALTSAEISLPAEADGARVSDRIAVLADTVDVVGLTDNHAGQPRMSPLAAVALAREQGVGTILHVSCRDRNRLALQSQVVGAAALGAEAVLCMQGDPVSGIERVGDMTATGSLRVRPHGAPRTHWLSGRSSIPSPRTSTGSCGFLRRKIASGATFVQSQMIFDLERLEAFLSAAEDALADVRFYASVALLRSAHMAERACALPGVAIPQRALAEISWGGGIDLARELAAGLATISRVDALHVFPLGAEAATREVAAELRVARGSPPTARQGPVPSPPSTYAPVIRTAVGPALLAKEAGAPGHFRPWTEVPRLIKLPERRRFTWADRERAGHLSFA